MKKLVAIIPVRAGSQRVKDKNFKPFAGKSLFEHKVETIKQLPVDDIIVNTDSELAIEKAKELGIGYHRREPYFASSECTNSEYHEYLAKVTEAENILVAQVTAPLLMADIYKTAIKEFYETDCNSLMSVKLVREFLWHNGKALNYDPENAPNSQDLPKYYAPTFGLVLAQRDAMLKARNLICSKPHFLEVSETQSIDIDTTLDFDFAEFMFKKEILNEY
ncbi:MAG: cytidylyltransferase domain-containing protein [Salibacteraceae bacterium]